MESVMAQKNYIFIKSKTGRPVHLIDIYTIDPETNLPLEIDITNRMIQENVALKIQRTPFLMSRVATEGDIEIVDEKDVVISSDDFSAQVAKEREAQAKADLENKGKNLRQALEDIAQAVSPEVAAVTFESTKPKTRTTKKVS
jgi:hypothetical protein